VVCPVAVNRPLPLTVIAVTVDDIPGVGRVGDPLSLQADAMRENSNTVYVSAVEGTGIDRLLDRIDAMIEEDRVSRVKVRIPQKEGKILAMLEAKSRISSRKYKDGSVELVVDAPESVVRRIRQWVVKGRA